MSSKPPVEFPHQGLVDELEGEVKQRYLLQKKVTVQLAEAVRRADAYSRLEAALRTTPRELA